MNNPGLNFDFKMVKCQDIYHKLLLKPIEIALKTRETEMTSFSDNFGVSINGKNKNGKEEEEESKSEAYIEQKKKIDRNDLPQGLKIAIKTSINENKHSLQNFIGVEKSQNNYELLIKNKQNNMISFLKHVDDDSVTTKTKAQETSEHTNRNNQHSQNRMKQNSENNSSSKSFQLLNCICMFSQDKKMLKDTLGGVQKNIINLVKSGVGPDQIATVVLFDGIQFMNSNVVELFETYQKQCEIFLEEGENQELAYEEMKRMSANRMGSSSNWWNKNEKGKKNGSERHINNINEVLFDQIELLDRQERRFKNVKQEYEETKKLKNEIAILMKQNPMYENLPEKVKEIFIDIAREEFEDSEGLMIKENVEKSFIKNKLNRQTSYELKDVSNEKIVQFYYQKDIQKYRSFIMKALKETQRFCDQYFTTRDSLAYLASYRLKIQLPQHQDSKKRGDQSQWNSLMGENDGLKIQLGLKPPQQHLTLTEPRKRYTHMNLFLCVKYSNGGKLTSHNWFFNGFCKELKPQYTILLDVGLIPYPDALYKMYRHMVQNDNVGGVCGYMSLKLERLQESQQINPDDVDLLTGFMLKFVDIQRAQQLEYHFSHLIDKPFEAIFNFIHVLPGAFSGYNMKALQSHDDQAEILFQNYFKSIDSKLKQNKIRKTEYTFGKMFLMFIFPEDIYNCCIPIETDSEESTLKNENIFLAEDRILCMGIHRNGKDMAYLPDAYAEVDPMKTLHLLLGQRKRWINGSFFAFQKVKTEMKEYRSQENKFECCLSLQIMYLTFMNFLSYFAPALFLFTVHIAMEAFRADVLPIILQNIISNPNTSQVYNAFVYTIDFIYVMLLGSVILFSLHLNNKHKKFVPFIYAVSTIFGLFQLIVVTVFIVDVIRGFLNNSTFLQENQAFVQQLPGGNLLLFIVRIVILGSIGIFGIPVILYSILFQKIKFFFDIILGALSFVFYSPTYLLILNIYAICRIDDISWGTKGLDKSNSKSMELSDKWRAIKYFHVAKFVFWNAVAGIFALSFGANYLPRFFITLGVVGILSATLVVRIFFGTLYLIKYKCCHRVSAPKQTSWDSNISRVTEKLKLFIEGIQEELIYNISGEAERKKQVNKAAYNDLIDHMLDANNLRLPELKEKKPANLLFERHKSITESVQKVPRKKNKKSKPKEAKQPSSNNPNTFALNNILFRNPIEEKEDE